MLWPSVFTAGFTAVPAIALFSSSSMLSIKLFKPFNWLRSSEDEMCELFTGNVGSNAFFWAGNRFSVGKNEGSEGDQSRPLR
jgi:hypothetical protein